MTLNIYLTRLPVGHTHEDIDARFGKLWVYIRSKIILSPSQWAKVMEECYGSSKLPFRQEDIMVLPNYKALFEPYLDQKLSTFTKEEDTQLAWWFRVTERSQEFPLGVKTMYRAYASDEVFEIVENTNSDIPEVPWSVCRTKCRWQPVRAGHEELGIQHDGLHVLNGFPMGPIIPAEFKPGHLKEFEICFRKISEEKWCGNSAQRAVDAYNDWTEFKNNKYPQTELVESYLTKHLLVVP
jgi:hypothetical protein